MVTFDFVSCWASLLGKSKDTDRAALDMLPEEILVRMIFPLLSVKEIMILRRVNKYLCLLTKKPAVWHNQLQYFKSLRQPFPPVPPLPQYDLDNVKYLPGHELERIISTAISYDIAWKRSEVRPWSYDSRFLFQYIEEIKLLPGGHFMVLSCRTHDRQYGISLWTLNHPATHQPAPLLFRITDVKAYGLQAKYMTVKGEKGICIALTRRWFKDENEEGHCPETFELGGKPDREDGFFPLKHECLVLFVRASLLEQLTDRRVKPLTPEYRQRLSEIAASLQGRDLWEVVTRIRTPAQIRASSLDVIDGQAHVCVLKASTYVRTPEAFNPLIHSRVQEVSTEVRLPRGVDPLPEGFRVKRRSGILFRRLDDGENRMLYCRNVPGILNTCESEIWNFRVLPEQHHVLVSRNYAKLSDEAMVNWREDKRMEHDVVTVGLYRVPAVGATIIGEEIQGLIYANHIITNCQISDPSTFRLSPDDNSLNSVLMKDNSDRLDPDPPLTCFFRTDKGFIHLPIFQTIEILPDEVMGKPEGKIRKFYDLDNNRGTASDSTATIIKHPSDPEKDEYMYDMTRFLPGCRRSLVYGIPYGSRGMRPPITDIVAFEDLLPSNHKILDRRPSAEDGIEDAEIENALFAGNDPIQQELLVMPPNVQEAAIEDDLPNDLSNVFPEKNAARPSCDVAPVAMTAPYADKFETPVTAISFDEHSGMLVAATLKDKMIHFIGFASVRKAGKEDDQLTMDMDTAFDLEKMRLVDNMMNPLLEEGELEGEE